MDSIIIRSYQSLRTNDSNGLVRRLRFAGHLATMSNKDAVATVQALADGFGKVEGVSKASVSKMTTAYRAFVAETTDTPDDVAQRLRDMGSHAAGITTLYRAYKAADDDVDAAWRLLESGGDIRGEDKVKDEGLSAIMSAVHAARQRGVADEDIVAAIDSL